MKALVNYRNMNNPLRPLIILLVTISGLLFAYSIIQAGINSLNSKPAFPDFLYNAVIIIAGILSTNFGSVLGITLTPPKGAVPHAAKFLGLRPTLQSTEQTIHSKTTDTPQKLQVIACWVYVGGLLLATVFYLIAISKNIPDADMVPLLSQLSKTLIGVLFGAMTVALGKN